MEENIVTVAMFTYKRAQAPATLYSGGCGPCIAVGAAYGNYGFMAHYPSNYLGPLEEMLLDLLRQVSNPSLLSMYATGGGIDSYFTKAERKRILHNRSQTLEKISKAGFASTLRGVVWGQGNSTTSLRLLLAEGKAVLRETFDESPENHHYKMLRFTPISALS